MRRMVLAALAAILVLAVPASASAGVCKRADHYRAIVVKKHGERAPGRNICRDGYRPSSGKVRPATYREKRDYRAKLWRLQRPPRYRTLVRTAVPPRQAPAGTLTASVAAPAGGVLDRIAQCESGGNPSAVSPDGRYRGKYQFDFGTWASVGGSGDPAAASEAEQDRRAAILYAQRGTAPWPVCGG